MVQELLGPRLERKISSQPLEAGNCGRPKCALCAQLTSERNNRCWSRSATYSITCTPCNNNRIRATYIGETSDVHRRLGQHLTGLENRRTDNILYQHSIQHHQGKPMEREDFKLEVTSNHKGPLSRQAEEGTRILLELASRAQDHPNLHREGESTREVILMNSRSEFHQPLGGIETFTRYLGPR